MRRHRGMTGSESNYLCAFKVPITKICFGSTDGRNSTNVLLTNVLQECHHRHQVANITQLQLCHLIRWLHWLIWMQIVVRDQRPEVRDQRPEVRDQRPEVRDQRSETRDQRSEVRDQRSETRDQRSETRGQRSETRGQRPEAAWDSSTERPWGTTVT